MSRRKLHGTDLVARIEATPPHHRADLLEAWGHRPRGEAVTVLASWRYLQPLVSADCCGYARIASWSAPLAGLGMGERVAWLSRELRHIERRHQAVRRVAA